MRLLASPPRHPRPVLGIPAALPRLLVATLACVLAIACASPAHRDAVARQAPVRCLQEAPVSEFQRDVLAEVNRARTDPAGYVEQIEAVYGSMDSANVYDAGTRRMSTVEGGAAVAEAIDFLRTTAALPALAMPACLNLAAGHHARAQGAIGASGHRGATGTTPSQRASRVTSAGVHCAENIALGYRTPRDIVAALIVDDGNPGRGHRANLFDPRVRSIGVGSANHLLRGSINVHLLCLEKVAG